MCVLRLDEAFQLCHSSDTEYAGKEIKQTEKMKHLVNSEFKKNPMFTEQTRFNWAEGTCKEILKGQCD